MAGARDSAYVSDLRAFAERVLSQHYGIRDAQISTRSGYMSDQAIVESGDEKWVLKIYGRGMADPESLRDSHRFVRFLADRSYPTPMPVLSARQRTLAEHEGKHCALFPFGDGNLPQPGNTAQLSAAGAALAELHRLSQAFEPAGDKSPADFMRCMLEAKRRELAAVETHLEPALWRRLRVVLTGSEKLLDRVHALSSWCMMIHGDFRGQNVLFSGDSVAAVLDLDSAAFALRLVDLAYALVFFQAVLAAEPMTQKETDVFLTAYEHVCPLSTIEKGLLPAFLRFSWLRGMLLWARIAYLDSASERAEGWIEAYRDYESLTLNTR